MIRSLFTILILAFSFFLGAKQLKAQSIHIPETITVDKNETLGLITNYRVKAKNTLYSICRFYDVDIHELQKINPEHQFESLQPGDLLRIPFKPTLLDVTEGNPKSNDYIPVYYRTSRKDNIFRISRIYFDQKIENMKQRNHLTDNNLQPGQLLLLGWCKAAETHTVSVLNENSIPDEKVVDGNPETGEEKVIFVKTIEAAGILKTEIDSISRKIETKPNDSIVGPKIQQIVQQNGLAIWNKESSVSGIFALHNDAKTGTLLEIYNPLLNRKSFVKVIGSIPGNTYPENVKVILSPEAAKSLGALDSRFYVKMNYIKP